MAWEVSIHRDVVPWLPNIFKTSPEIGDRIEDAIDQLSEQGPALGRPLVDRIHSSKRLHKLKELRPRAPGGAEIRLLFVFDFEREAIILVAGDKSGSWNRWYDTAIPPGRGALRRVDRGQGQGRTGRMITMGNFVKWSDVKDAIRAADPGHDAPERVAARTAHREETQAMQRGHQLAEERKRLGMSQAQIAELMGISQARISKIESDGISDMDTVRSYAEALGGRMYSVIEIEDHVLRVA